MLSTGCPSRVLRENEVDIAHLYGPSHDSPSRCPLVDSVVVLTVDPKSFTRSGLMGNGTYEIATEKGLFGLLHDTPSVNTASREYPGS